MKIYFGRHQRDLNYLIRKFCMDNSFPIVQYSPVTNASLNALSEVAGVLGWSNYGSISANYFTVNVKLRAE